MFEINVTNKSRENTLTQVSISIFIFLKIELVLNTRKKINLKEETLICETF